MKTSFSKESGITKDVTEFTSISDLCRYIDDRPLNAGAAIRFSDETPHSHTPNERFTGTRDYTEAREMLEKGWSVETEKIADKLKIETTKLNRNFYRNGVFGFFPVVPNFLANRSDSMVAMIREKVPKKVVTINKLSCNSAGVSCERMFGDSIKSFKLIQQVEASGVRVNLVLVFCARNEWNVYNVVKIRLKNANERLNLSKLTFPTIHPSMLRRIIFRFYEVHETIPRTWYSGYGIPVYDTEKVKSMFCRADEYMLPSLYENGIDPAGFLKGKIV